MSVLTDYYPDIDAEKMAVLVDLWGFAQSIAPKAEEGLSYGLPALKLNGRPLIGFSVAKQHMTVYPFSPKVIEAVRSELSEFEVSKGLVRFTESHTIPKSVIEAMIELRVAELEQ